MLCTFLDLAMGLGMADKPIIVTWNRVFIQLKCDYSIFIQHRISNQQPRRFSNELSDPVLKFQGKEARKVLVLLPTPAA